MATDGHFHSHLQHVACGSSRSEHGNHTQYEEPCCTQEENGPSIKPLTLDKDVTVRQAIRKSFGILSLAVRSLSLAFDAICQTIMASHQGRTPAGLCNMLVLLLYFSSFTFRRIIEF